MRTGLALGSLLLAFGAAPGCGGGGGDGQSAVCVPRAQQQCVGPNSCAGVQQCDESGASFTECVCSNPGSGGVNSVGGFAGAPGGGTANEGGTSNGGTSSGGTGNQAGDTNGGSTNTGGTGNHGGSSGDTSAGGAAAGGTTSEGGSANHGGTTGGTVSHGGTTGGTVSHGGAGGAPSDSCAVGNGTLGLIDNFEDNDLSSLANDGRTSERWQAHNDAVMSYHSGGTFASCTLTSAAQACGVNFHPVCYDATAYSGIKVVLRGRGVPILALKTPDTAPISEGGRCKSKPDGKGNILSCGDYFRVVLPELEASDWVTHTIPWSKFKQGGWGVPVPEFKVEELMSVIFGPNFWPETTGDAKIEIDRIEFY